EIGILPFGGNPALLFEPVQGGVERTLANGEDVAGEELDAFRDSPSVSGRSGDGFQYEQVQGPLEQIGRLGHAIPRSSTIIPRLSTVRNVNATRVWRHVHHAAGSRRVRPRHS